MADDSKPKSGNEGLSRRHFLSSGVRAAGFTGVGVLVGTVAGRSMAENTVWQIDPHKCLRCDKCATSCVLPQSAVKCVQVQSICGYCNLCTGYFVAEPNDLNTAAENQLCPTGAIKRRFVEDPYYEYTIDEPLCIGCARCVDGCIRFGNGSMFLQIRHDLCVNCNECSIAKVCPGDAFRRIPANHPYLLKTTAAH